MHSAQPTPEEDTALQGGNDPTPEADLRNRHARRVAKRRDRLAERATAKIAAVAEADESRAIAAIREAARASRRLRNMEVNKW